MKALVRRPIQRMSHGLCVAAALGLLATPGFAQSVEATYGVDEAALLAAIDPTVLGEPTTTLPGREAPGGSR